MGNDSFKEGMLMHYCVRCDSIVYFKCNYCSQPKSYFSPAYRGPWYDPQTVEKDSKNETRD